MSSKHLWLLNRDCFDRLIEAFTTEPPPRVITTKEEALLNSAISFAFAPPSKTYWLGVTSKGFMGEDNYGTLRSLYNTLPPMKSKPKLRVVKARPATTSDELLVTNPNKLKKFLFYVEAGQFLCKDQLEWLIGAFRWNRTPQGEKYWSDIYHGDRLISSADLEYLATLVTPAAKTTEVKPRRFVETDSGQVSRLIGAIQAGRELSDKACEFLDTAFDWKGSPQGYDHWFDLYTGKRKVSQADLEYLKSLVVPYNPAKLEFVS